MGRPLVNLRTYVLDTLTEPLHLVWVPFKLNLGLRLLLDFPYICFHCNAQFYKNVILDLFFIPDCLLRQNPKKMLTKQQKFLLAQLVRENKDVLLRKFGSPGKQSNKCKLHHFIK